MSSKCEERLHVLVIYKNEKSQCLLLTKVRVD
jgi:hypothetical protein